MPAVIYTIALFCAIVAATTSLVIRFQFPPLSAYVGQSLLYAPLILLVLARN